MATLEQIVLRRARAIQQIVAELQRLGVRFELPPTRRAFVYQQETNEAELLEAIADALSRVKAGGDKRQKEAE